MITRSQSRYFGAGKIERDRWRARILDYDPHHAPSIAAA